MNKSKQKLYVMCGCPGSGKSTFAKECLEDFHTIYVSRDNIRFSFVREDEEYFSKENQVYNAFINEIKTNLEKGFNVIADATHLSAKSRSKLFFRLYSNLNNVEIIMVVINSSLELCVERNEMRKGTRAYVPYKELVKMYRAFSVPSFSECNGIIDYIYIINNDDTILVKRKGEGDKINEFKFDGLFRV